MTHSLPKKTGVIADDLTGSGDVAVKFVSRGLKTAISIDVDDISAFPQDCDVWVINTQSRSLSPELAAQKALKAYNLLKDWGSSYYYKKIDSTLRGNIGAELASLHGLIDSRIPFCAAYPDNYRTTKDSVHYVRGIPVADTEYAKDPVSPVADSDIARLLSLQMPSASSVDIIDAVTNKDLAEFAEKTDKTFICGASALAGFMAGKWYSRPSLKTYIEIITGPVLIISGSDNPLSRKQVLFCTEKGYNLLISDKPASTEELQIERTVISITEERSKSAMSDLESLSAQAYKTSLYRKFILNGGDTSYMFMKVNNIDSLQVKGSLMPGIALCESKGRQFVLKPGGFGSLDALHNLYEMIR